MTYLQTQYQKVTSGFHSLSNSPSELYKTYILKFLDSYSYFSFALIFTLFLSDEFGMDDVEAGKSICVAIFVSLQNCYVWCTII